jgi:hypothetical protein
MNGRLVARQPAGLNLAADEGNQLLKDDPGPEAITGLIHMDSIHEEIRILRQRGRDIEERNFSNRGVAAKDAILKVSQAPDVGVPQWPQ